MNKSSFRAILKSLSFFGLFFVSIIVLLYTTGQNNPVEAAGTISNAYDTLTNPRLSFKGIVSGTLGNNIVSLKGGTEPAPDKDVEHLFIGDSICFPGPLQDGCANQATYSVTSVDIGNTRFSFSPTLVNMVKLNDWAIATQSARHSITFKPSSALSGTQGAPAKILIKIPMTATTGKTSPYYYNDGIPDSDGFDAAGLGVTGPNTIQTYLALSPASLTMLAGSSTYSTIPNFHVITVLFAGTPTSSTQITVDIGTTGADTTKYFINPAKSLTPTRSGTEPGTAHISGKADIWPILIETRNDVDVAVDAGTVRVAPVEGVQVSAYVDQTLTFKMCGVKTDKTLNNTYESTCTFAGVGLTAPTQSCGVSGSNFDFLTDNVHVAFNGGAAITQDTFYTGAQFVQVSTNAQNGYDLQVLEWDQMGINGNICSGTAPAADGFTFGSYACIRDTVCDSACTHTTTSEWNTATNYGLGYSLQNLNNGDTPFEYNESARTFSAKSFPDTDRALYNPIEAPQNIMTSSTAKAKSSAYVCYRVTVSETQPAGYYYNTVKYIATAKF